MSRALRLFTAATALTLIAGACSQDSPEQELPCEYWVDQYGAGGVDLDKVPSEFQKAVQGDETCDQARARAEG